MAATAAAMMSAVASPFFEDLHLASTTAPALIGIDPSYLAGNDRSAIPQFNPPAQASLPAVLGKTNYCTGIELDYTGATGAIVAIATVSGVRRTGDARFTPDPPSYRATRSVQPGLYDVASCAGDSYGKEINVFTAGTPLRG
jgi:hypothetical protein